MPFIKNADGSLLLAQTGRYGKEVIYATHNLCDQCTWYSESLRVTDGAMTDSGDGLTFTSPHAHWTDLSHGKVFDEEGLIEDQKILNPGDPHGYSIEVKVDGVAMTQRAPFAFSGGDYEVDYVGGRVTFYASQAGKAVTASYSYANTSAWILQPLPGKTLVIEKSEVQFSADIRMEKAFIMEVYGNADYFAPHLGLPPGTPIPLESTIYKTIDQLIDEAVLAFPEIPVLGGPRGYTQSRHVFQFYYAAVRGLYSSLGMYVRILMEDDAAFSGERATATFYCLSQTDPGPEKALELLSAE
jgi:hypothetical protein